MATELKINDSATWRTIKHVEIKDSSTWRDIFDININDSGTWRKVFGMLAEYTVTPSDQRSFGDGVIGYVHTTLAPPGYGSINTSVFGRYTVGVVRDFYSSGIWAQSGLYIFGFASNPGQNGVFTSVTVNGVTKTAASATYSWDPTAPGTAGWTWTDTKFNLFDLTPVAMSIQV